MTPAPSFRAQRPKVPNPVGSESLFHFGQSRKHFHQGGPFHAIVSTSGDTRPARTMFRGSVCRYLLRAGERKILRKPCREWIEEKSKAPGAKPGTCGTRPPTHEKQARPKSAIIKTDSAETPPSRRSGKRPIHLSFFLP